MSCEPPWCLWVQLGLVGGLVGVLVGGLVGSVGIRLDGET